MNDIEQLAYDNITQSISIAGNAAAASASGEADPAEQVVVPVFFNANYEVVTSTEVQTIHSNINISAYVSLQLVCINDVIVDIGRTI